MPSLHHLIKTSQARELLQSFTRLLPGSGLALVRPDGNIFASSGDLASLPKLSSQPSDAPGIHPLLAGEELIAYLAVSPAAIPVLPPIIQSLSLFIQQALEKREVARETLDRYREINLLYNTAETIGACLDADEIPSLVLKESARVIPADARMVLLRPAEGTGDLALVAEETTLARSYNVLLSQARELVERVLATGRPDLQARNGSALAFLCTPLKGRERVLGAVVLARATPIPENPPFAMEAALPFTAGEEKLLMALSGLAGIAIEKAWMHRQELERQRLEQELAIGRRIQRSLLPEMVPHLAGWEFACQYLSAREVGGDFYDFYEGDALGLFIADVTGKGVPAALMMAFSRAMLRTLLHSRPEIAAHPAETLQRLNTLLLGDNRSGLMLTALFASLDPLTGRLLYANAGHERPIWLRYATGECQELASQGAILGAFRQVAIEERQVDMGPGDLVVFYTDGISEARSVTGEIFGEERLLETVKSCRGASAEQASQRIFEAAQSFATGAAQADDFTMLVIRRLAQDHPGHRSS